MSDNGGSSISSSVDVTNKEPSLGDDNCGEVEGGGGVGGDAPSSKENDSYDTEKSLELRVGATNDNDCDDENEREITPRSSGGDTVEEAGSKSTSEQKPPAEGSNHTSTSTSTSGNSPAASSSLSILAPPQPNDLDYHVQQQQQQQHHDNTMNGSSYLPSHYRPLLPPLTTNSIAATAISNTNNHLDATRQYYEAQMREHAMQYANAAAGAAWAAAQLSLGMGVGVGGGGQYHALFGNHHHHQQHPPPPHGYYYDGNNHHGEGGYYLNSGMGNVADADVMTNPYLPSQYTVVASHLPPSLMLGLNQQQHPATMNNYFSPISEVPPLRQKRTLWHPPTDDSDAKGHQNKSQRGTTMTTATMTPPIAKESSTPNDKKGFKKKRESGNDSLPSHGSESREWSSQQKKSISRCGADSGKPITTCEKSKQQRHINEQEHENDEQLKQPLNVNATTARRSVHADVEGTSGSTTVNNIRQKRGLNYGQSSVSSLSSNDYQTSRQYSSGGRSKKKKNRSQQQPENSISTSSPSSHTLSKKSSSVVLGGLIGKNAVRALHELCSKYHWDIPTFTDIAPSQIATTTTTTPFAGGEDGANHLQSGSTNGNNDTTTTPFVLSVHVNGVELGRGRACSKSAAKQSASRKAFSALVPGSVFDPNGILTDVGTTGESLLRREAVENAISGRVDVGGGGADNNRESNNIHLGSKSLSLDELGPHLAVQLAIGGATSHPGAGRIARPLSPDHSETSSISTAVSEDVLPGGALISGGPLLLLHKTGSHHSSTFGASSPLIGASGVLSPNSYPCASTTSGISSASDVDDEDENAYYASRGASICSTLLHAMWQIDDRIREPPSYSFKLCSNLLNIPEQTVSSEPCNFKRAKVESSLEHAGSRMFQCNASLNLYFPKILVNGKDSTSIMNYWQSPLDYLQSEECIPSIGRAESLQSRKRKDSNVLQSTPLPNRSLISQELAPSLSKQEENEDFIQHKLNSRGMGITKRESKHKASAILLSSLFPSCKSMIEVKAEAEAAREFYAAKKEAGQPKRAKISIQLSEQRQQSTKVAFPDDLPAKSDISLTSLSLSESKDDTRQVEWSGSTNIDLSFQDDVDATLQSMQELDEGGRLASRECEDIGKIILRRASFDDCEQIQSLLSSNEKVSAKLPKKHWYLAESAAEEIGLPSESEENDDDVPRHDTTSDINEYDSEAKYTNYNAKEHPLEENSIILVLSRAVAPHEPLLACAILAVHFARGERSLSLCKVGRQEHLPLERFIEYLEAFAKNTQCTVEKCNDVKHQLTLTANDIRSFLVRSARSSKRPEEDLGSIRGTTSNCLLQSVKEEESEEVDDGSDGGEHDAAGCSKRSRME